MRLSFVIQRADEYAGDAYGAEELAVAAYVVEVGNGDSHLLNSVAEIEQLVSGELFLHGYEDEEADNA